MSVCDFRYFNDMEQITTDCIKQIQEYKFKKLDELNDDFNKKVLRDFEKYLNSFNYEITTNYIQKLNEYDAEWFYLNVIDENGVLNQRRFMISKNRYNRIVEIEDLKYSSDDNPKKYFILFNEYSFYQIVYNNELYDNFQSII